MSDEETILVCVPVTQKAAVRSVRGDCSECGRGVWVAISSPEASRIVCAPCMGGIARAKGLDHIEFEALTETQRADLLATIKREAN